MFHDKFYIKIQSQVEEIYVYIRIYSIFIYVFATVAIEVMTKLTDTYNLNLTVALTPEFQGEMIWIVFVVRLQGPICTK